MNIAYKFRIYPTKKQISFFDESVRTGNFIYNVFLRKQIDILDEANEKFGEDKKARNKYMTDNKLWFNKFETSLVLTKMSKEDEFSFLKIPDSTSRAYVLKNLDAAFSKIKSGGGFPKFKNKKSTYSFTGQIGVYNNLPKIKIFNKKNKHCFIKISKCDNIKMICHIPFFLKNWDDIKKIKFNSYTISRKSKDKYYISFQVEIEDLNLKQKNIDVNTSIGIDFGVKRPITTSNINDYNNDTYSKQFNLLLKYKEKIKKYSSILNRKKEYHKKNNTGLNFYETSSFKRINKKLSDIHFKIANCRTNIQHNITSSLVNNNEYNTFIIEKLEIKNMTKKSAKGKSNKKSNLNRVMLDTGLGAIKTQLEYKSKSLGKNLLTVNPRYTSQECSNCGHINKLNRKTQSEFNCVKCGFEINADYNAAINIKNKYFNALSK